MIVLRLNQESAAVLLRCLSYGQAAISQEETNNGIEEVLVKNIEALRQDTCRGISKEIISQARKEKK